MAEASPSTMDYGFLSKTCGLKVSKLCFGAMTFGSSEHASLPPPGQLAEPLCFEMLDRYVELGGNFIDTANAYTGGASECVVGNWVKKSGKRDDLVIATKGYLPTDTRETSPNDIGLSRKNLVKSLTASLERLQLEYIDLYQVHCFDFGTPLQETLRTLDDFVRCGKVRHIGASNYGGWQLQKSLMMAEQMGLDKFITLQNQYNLLTRDGEFDAFQVCENEGVGIIPYSPLKYGLLTDKYADKKQTESIKGSRQEWVSGVELLRTFMQFNTFDDLKDNPLYWKLMDTLKAVGQDHGKNIAQVSIKWLTQKPAVTSVIIGTKTMKQLEENMEGGANTWSLSQDQMEKLEKASDAFFHVANPYNVQPLFNVNRYNV